MMSAMDKLKARGTLHGERTQEVDESLVVLAAMLDAVTPRLDDLLGVLTNAAFDQVVRAVIAERDALRGVTTAMAEVLTDKGSASDDF